MASATRLFNASILIRTLGKQAGKRLSHPAQVQPLIYSQLCRRWASTETKQPESIISPPAKTPVEVASPTANVDTTNIASDAAATTTSLADVTPSLAFHNLPDDVRWEAEPVFDKAANAIANIPELTGAIIPFKELNFAQQLFAPYQYPIMHYLDFLTTQMPWWMSIVGATVTIRLLFFPLVLKMNKIGIRIYNLMPETQRLQVKINDATLNGDAYQAALAKTKLQLLYQEHDVKISQRLIPTLIQSPAFLCFFFTLRNLANYYKVPGLVTGGALWFTDLSLPDPYYVMPLITSVSMWLLLEFGLEGSSGPLKTMGPVARWGLRIVPFSLLFLFKGFPSAVLLFWTTNNSMTLLYSLLLRQKWIKKKLNIPERLNHPPESLPMTNVSFRSQIAKSIEQAKGTKTTLDLRRLDDIQFQKVSVGPLRKTYKNPPKKDTDQSK